MGCGEDPLPRVRVVLRASHGVHLAGVLSDKPPSPKPHPDVRRARAANLHSHRQILAIVGACCNRRCVRRDRRELRMIRDGGDDERVLVLVVPVPTRR